MFLGATFAFAGLQKLADPLFLSAGHPGSLAGQLALVKASSPIGWALGPVSAHPTFFGVAIALTEIAVGVGTLIGLFTRVAAAVGLVLALSFWLTISWRTRPYYYGSDVVFAVAWLTMLLAGPVAPAADLALARNSAASLGFPPDPARYARPEAARFRREYTRRRSLLAGAAGLATLVVAGSTAWLGRALGGNRGGQGTSAAPAPPGAGAPTPTGTGRPGASGSPSAAASGPTGSPLAAVSAVPVGGGKVVSDTTGAPLLLLQPSAGRFRAFSAICTHAGCTVGLDRGVILCPCHGGQYDPTSGQVLAGPPPAPLTPIKVTVVGGQVYQA